jgi:phosphoglycerol transferase MdoB-like AlkP superfamily enzyme
MPNVSKLKIEEKSLATKYSLPNMFKEQGYTTNFFHNWKKDFYDRDKTISNIGFDNFYSLENFENENKSTRFNYYNLEVDFYNQFAEKIAPENQKFFSFYTTVSSHGSYQVENEKFAEYYAEYDRNITMFRTWLEKEKYIFPESTDEQAILKHYKSAAMDTDRMVELLFKRLNTTGLIENTTVILYSDHNAYYHNLAYKIKNTNPTDYKNQVSHIVPCMIYSNKITGKDNYNFTSAYDLYPTITSLFGLKYNTNCKQGVDIMTNKDNIGFYMSHLTGYYSAGCYSKDMSYIVSYKNSSNDITAFKKAACEFYQKQLMLETIYFAKLKY